MRDNKITINGLTIDYVDSVLSSTDSNKQAHLPLVMLHGLGGNATSFFHQFEVLGSQRRVVAWHAPGYGRSDCIDANGNAYAQHLLAFLDALDIPRCVLLGHSMGGMLAGKVIEVAPSRVAALVLSCTHGGYAKSSDAPLSADQQQRLDELRTLSPQAYGHARAISMSAANAAQEAVESLSAIAAQTRYEGLQAAIRMINGLDNLNALRRYSGPALIINGDEDRVISEDKRDALHAAMPNATRVLFEGAGHAPYLEQPQRYNDVLTTFLATNSI